MMIRPRLAVASFVLCACHVTLLPSSVVIVEASSTNVHVGITTTTTTTTGSQQRQQGIVSIDGTTCSLDRTDQDQSSSVHANRPTDENSNNNNNNNNNTLSPFDIFEMILSQDLQGMDDRLPQCVAALKSRGAHRCWHKHSTFLEHLLGVHHILRLWGQGPTIGRVGLFHSAYSNSYVNLALFQPQDPDERTLMQSLIGDRAEELVHLFCIINRQEVVVNTLLKQGYIPTTGLHVPHLRHPNESVYLDAETLRMLVVFTMADIADQYFGWQDHLFGGDDHSMLLPGMDQVEAHTPTALWPGLSKPGLWMNYVSQLGIVARSFRDQDGASCPANVSSSATIPPVFDHCTKLLTREDEIRARDLYWSVMTGQVTGEEEVLDVLQRCIELNPWVFEPHVVLAQTLLHRQDFDGAQQAAERAMTLQRQWGTAWDKRLSFAAWVAWTRVMHQRAQDKLAWPTNSWDVNNFGLVRG